MAKDKTLTGRGKCSVCNNLVKTTFLNLWCCENPKCMKTLQYWVNNTL